ncbi:MAG: hypothetical protein H0V18_10670 [Pyrinomonadaceae bacterium]|jgi:predicted anti-sigma-YlaC factor YlaD|nr:hypothetical protein [Pyrinomonadaceae bacterium]
MSKIDLALLAVLAALPCFASSGGTMVGQHPTTVHMSRQISHQNYTPNTFVIGTSFAEIPKRQTTGFSTCLENQSET